LCRAGAGGYRVVVLGERDREGSRASRDLRDHVLDDGAHPVLAAAHAAPEFRDQSELSKLGLEPLAHGAIRRSADGVRPPIPEQALERRACALGGELRGREDRKSTRLNSSHVKISYAVFCLKKK